MKIELKKIPVRDLVNGYINNDEEGVIGYDGKLNIRPKYQREFIYKDKQRDEVIRTIKKNFPLNVMYWVKNNDWTYEVLDWQQRTISICEYVVWNYAINYQYFHSLTNDEQKQILDYELMVYFCEWNDKEKLEWFKTINIAWEKLTDQELRNAIYTWPWLTDAKRHFSKTNCPAYDIAKDYLKGSPIRQVYLETVIKWISDDNIEEYMSKHQQNSNATELWMYFINVINWVKILFPNYRKEMKWVNWWELYNKYRDNKYNPDEFEKEVVKLMQDEDVTNTKGIYSYLFTRDEKYLSIRAFTLKQKREIYEKQNWICAKCGEHFEFEEMEADHIKPWSEGGKTTTENCQILCKMCNRKKSNI